MKVNEKEMKVLMDDVLAFYEDMVRMEASYHYKRVPLIVFKHQVLNRLDELKIVAKQIYEAAEMRAF